MLKIAKKHKTNLATMHLTPHLSAQLLAWYHVVTRYRPLQGVATKCLIRKHKATTVANLLQTSNRIRNVATKQHRLSPYCHCKDCIIERRSNCLNPYACAQEALVRLQQITPKLNPLKRAPLINNLSLTTTRKARNKTMRKTNEEITFNPSITSRTNLAECFRIFIDLERISNIPVIYHQTFI